MEEVKKEKMEWPYRLINIDKSTKIKKKCRVSDFCLIIISQKVIKFIKFINFSSNYNITIYTKVEVIVAKIIQYALSFYSNENEY